jgi:hypothetical protein
VCCGCRLRPQRSRTQVDAGVLSRVQTDRHIACRAWYKIRQLELGLQDLGPPLPDDHPVVASVLAAISDPATQKRLTPRRPNLLPQLMRAINDEEVSRRELSVIIARDPSMVGSLLKIANSAYYRVAAAGLNRSNARSSNWEPMDCGRWWQARYYSRFSRSTVPMYFRAFPEVVWEHAQRSAHAAIPHVALVERADAFGAELLCLITGLAQIIVSAASPAR